MSMLTYYYLSALVIGYCAGHFLLISSGNVPRWAGKMAVAAVWACVLVVPVALAGRNLEEIRFTNGPALRQFAKHLYADLPAGKSAVLSDDVQQLFLLRAEAGRHRAEKDLLLVETGSLSSPWYHDFMVKRFQGRWPIASPTNKVEVVGPLKRLNVVAKLAAQQPLAYLYPGFGRYFEFCCARPEGLFHRLLPRDKKSDGLEREGESQPRLEAQQMMAQMDPKECKLEGELVAGNEALWQQRWKELNSIRERVKAFSGPPQAGGLARWARLSPERTATAVFLGAAYARALNHWGVQLQRLGRDTEAAVWFGRAIELKENNLAALINLEYNERCRRGEKQRLPGEWLEKSFHQLSGNYGNWLDVLAEDGPVDEPTVLFKIAQALLQEGNVRQATREFARCKELAPDWAEPGGWLALGYINAGDAQRALALTHEIEKQEPPPAPQILAELIVCRTSALQQLGRTNEIATVLQEFVGRYGERTDVVGRAAELYMQNRQFGRAVILLNHLLNRAPADLQLLSQKGRAELELSRFEEAIAALTNVVALVGADDPARLDLALARLRAGHLEAAEQDFQNLLKTLRHRESALFGLGSIAWRRQDTNQAVEFYAAFLSNAVPGLPQYRIARERLAQMGAGGGGTRAGNQSN
jgi:tetratricopeptide (TPR) repeat protein